MFECVILITFLIDSSSLKMLLWSHTSKQIQILDQRPRISGKSMTVSWNLYYRCDRNCLLLIYWLYILQAPEWNLYSQMWCEILQGPSVGNWGGTSSLLKCQKVQGSSLERDDYRGSGNWWPLNERFSGFIEFSQQCTNIARGLK